MKSSTLLIALSLGANLALGCLLLRPRGPDARPVAIPSSSSTAPSAKPSPAAETPKPDAKAFGAIFAGDIKDVVARMKAAGFAPALIRSIAEGYVREQFRARYEAIARDIPAWDVNANVRALETNPEYHALDLELRKAVRDLVGPHDMERTEADLKRIYGSIPPVKVAQVEEIMSRYWDLRDDLRGAPAAAAVPTASAALDRQRRAEIEATLTAEELVEFDRRASNSAFSLRSTSEAFAMTEPEFTALLKPRQAYDEPYAFDNLGGMSPPDRTRLIKESELKYEEDIDAALGPERAEAFRTLGDSQYPATREMTDRLGLPVAIAAEVIKLRRDSTKRRNSMLGAPGRTTDDAIRAERARQEDLDTAQAGLKALLGERGYEIYTQSRLGNWAITPNVIVRN